MQNTSRSDTESDRNTYTFKSPLHNSYEFEVAITEKYDQSLKFRIEFSDGGSTKVFSHVLPDRQHHSYLDLYAKLSGEIGLKLPLNKAEDLYAPKADVSYRELLTDNLHPDILYGYGDPAVLRVDDGDQITFYLVATSNDAENSFPILKSPDLIHWEMKGFVFPEGKKPLWTAEGEHVSDYWAPELHKVGDEFRLYFVARDKYSSELCIGFARSSSPEGPFIAETEPLLKNNVIDPHLYVENGQAYLFWKDDNNDVWPSKLLQLLQENPNLINSLFSDPAELKTALLTITLLPWMLSLPAMERFQAQQAFIESVIDRYTIFFEHLRKLKEQHPALGTRIDEVLTYMKTPMFAQALSDDGRTLMGQRVKIIENDLDWEAHLVEGMWVTKSDGKYFLFYAGNDFSTHHYGIGVAVADHLLGPYTKQETPFLQSTATWKAPGHPSVVTDLNNQQTMLLHAYKPGKAGYKEFRALLAITLKFTGGEVKI